MRNMSVVGTCIAALVINIVACDSDTDGAASGGNGGSGGGGAPVAYSVTFDATTIAPGEEKTQCVLKRLGNPAPIYINRIENTLGAGSHHLILYRSSETEEQPTPFDCAPFTNLLKPESGVPLMIAQRSEDALTLPSGIGIALEPQQMIRIEMHYINTSQSPMEVEASANFHTMDASDLEAEADFFFGANASINLDPSMEVTLGPQFLELPAELAGASFFAFTGHQHKLGKGVTVTMAESPGGTEAPVYAPEDYTWDEPPTQYHDPPITIPTGGGFNLTCSWDNTSTSAVGFGESANDEMCAFWSYYYPSKGPKACAHHDALGEFCCPGSPICSMLP